MKNIIVLITLVLSLGLKISLFGQTTIEISGTIKSSQGALQGAEIDFLNLNDEFQGNCVSGPNGKFKSENKMQVGRTIKIRVSKTGYETSEKTYKIDKMGDAGEFMLKRKILTISGFVKDSIAETALTGAEIFFYDESKLIQSRSTNSQGYFDLETGFTYGQKITVRVSKSGYHDKEQTLTFTSEGRNTLQDILLPQLGDRGLRAFIRIKDKKKGKPLGNVAIRYFDKKKSSYIDTMVSSKGEQLELKLYQRPGTTLDLQISKPNYVPIQAKLTLSEDPLSNVYEYEMERDRRSAVGPVLLIGTGVSALVGGGMYLSSNSKYNNYKDFGNANRESDYTSAQSSRTIAIVAGGVAAGAIIAYIIYKINQKNKEKDAQQKKTKTVFQHFAPLNQSYALGNRPIIGLTYQF